MSLWFIFSLLLLGCCALFLMVLKSTKQTLIIFIIFPILVVGSYIVVGSPNFTPQPPPSPIELMLFKAEAHLIKTPDDLRGWQAVAPVYSRLGQFNKAVMAYREILRLEGENEVNTLNLAENLLLQNIGKITDESLSLFNKYKNTPKAIYYLAIAKEQTGDKLGAIADLQALLLNATEQEKPFLQQEIERINK